jgi:hypothetical protein
VLYFLDHIGSSIKKDYRFATPEVSFVFMSHQPFDANSSPVQDIDDPVENRELIIC